MMRKPGHKIRVLVVDDSLVVREMVCAILASDPELTVVGEARDGLEAVSKAISLKPDIVTMDIEMPVLNGLDAIEKIMGQHPMPILAVTSLSGVRTAFKAVSKGALDVLEKSDIDIDDGAKLIRKIKMLADVDAAAHQIAMLRPSQPKKVEQPKPQMKRAETNAIRIVAIAASTGGPQALSTILSQLPAAFPVPIVIAQHVAAGFTDGIADWLNTCTELLVTPAHHGDILRPGQVYLNPSEFLMKVSRQGFILLSENAPGQLYHPSCDTLLCSVAETFGAGSVGIILSGMGKDGVSGMGAIRSAGGVTFAQDEESSVIFGMNGLAIKQSAVETVLPLAEIPEALVRLAGLNHGGSHE